MILLILVLAIIILCAFNGFRKGLFGIVSGVISWVVIILSVVFLSPVMQNHLEKRTDIGNRIYESAKGYIEQKLTRTSSGTLDFMLPPAMDRAIRGTAQEAIEKYNFSASVEEAKGTLVSFVAEPVASKIRDYAIFGLSKVLTFLIAALACFAARIIFKVVMFNRGFAIKQHILGALFGLIEGFLLVWILMYLISCIGTTEFGRSLSSAIDQNVILSWFYNNNPLAGLMH